jgi:two-component system, OmpR family, alkaline phosphatase synthesis response regulator PhoP
MNRVLVVDDEPKIVRLASDYLEHAGFEVLRAGNGPDTLRMARTEKPEAIVLDLGLPGLDGLDVARAIRQTSSVPIIMLTARGEEADRIAGLELGADDYIVKPFSPRELVARVRAVLRRAEHAAGPMGAETLRVLDMTLDIPKMRAERGGHPIELTPAEFTVLETLMRQPGRIFTRGQLLEVLHGVAFESYERAIDTHIKNLRRKLEIDPRKPRYLLTVYGVGYRFADA